MTTVKRETEKKLERIKGIKDGAIEWRDRTIAKQKETISNLQAELTEENKSRFDRLKEQLLS